MPTKRLPRGAPYAFLAGSTRLTDYVSHACDGEVSHLRIGGRAAVNLEPDWLRQTECTEERRGFQCRKACQWTVRSVSARRVVKVQDRTWGLEHQLHHSGLREEVGARGNWPHPGPTPHLPCPPAHYRILPTHPPASTLKTLHKETFRDSSCAKPHSFLTKPSNITSAHRKCLHTVSPASTVCLPQSGNHTPHLYAVHAPPSTLYPRHI